MSAVIVPIQVRQPPPCTADRQQVVVTRPASRNIEICGPPEPPSDGLITKIVFEGDRTLIIAGSMLSSPVRLNAVRYRSRDDVNQSPVPASTVSHPAPEYNPGRPPLPDHYSSFEGRWKDAVVDHTLLDRE